MSDPTHRACLGCQVIKPLTDFQRHSTGKYGRKTRCRECTAIENRAWRKANPGYKKSRKGKSRETYTPERYQRRRGTILANSTRRRANRVARTDEQVLLDRAAARPDGMKPCTRCQQTFPLESFYFNRGATDGLTGQCVTCHTRRNGGRQTFAFWESVGIDRHACTYCDVPLSVQGESAQQGAQRLTFDHVIPISKGGDWNPSNLVPACKSCNSSKGNRNLNEWLAGRKTAAA